ncbi:MAG: hypothetical protein WCP12_15350 [bacterium]
MNSWLRSTRPFCGKQVADLDAFVKEVLASGSTAANPRPVTAEDARLLLAEILSCSSSGHRYACFIGIPFPGS